MGVKLDFEAVNELPNPLAPGTIYYLDHGDGTATQVVTDATGQVTGRQVVGLMTSGSLSRTGAVTNRLTRTGSNFMQHFTNTSGVPIVLTELSIEGVTGPGSTGELLVAHAVTRAILARGDATLSNGVLRTTFTAPYIWAPGAELALGWYNNDTDGSGNPISSPLTFSLSSGHTWEGITLSNTNLWTSFFALSGQVGENNGAPTAQLRFQFGAGGQVIRRVVVGDGLTGKVQGGTLRVTRKRIWGDGVTVAGDGSATQPLTAPGSETWTGRLWRRAAGHEPVIDPTQRPDRVLHLPSLDLDNFVLGAQHEGFNAVFVGLVSPAYSEAYTLNVYSDDGVRVWLDEVLVLDSWVLSAPGTLGDVLRSAPLGPLEQGRTYLMRVEWYQFGTTPDSGGVNPNRLRVARASASQSDVLIPVIGDPALENLESRLAAIEAHPAPATYLSGPLANRPAFVAEGDHYYAVDVRQLWKWAAGVWVLLAAFVADVPVATDSIIAVGDSITYGYGIGGPPMPGRPSPGPSRTGPSRTPGRTAARSPRPGTCRW